MIGFPLLLIPLAIYNIIAFLMRDVSFAAPLVTVPLPSGTGWPVTLSDVLLTLGDPAVAFRGHQGRAPRREISHRPSAFAAGVRRRGSGIRAAAAIRHLDLFPADAAGAGGFPVWHRAADAAQALAGPAVSKRRAAESRGRRRARAPVRTGTGYGRACARTGPSAAPRGRSRARWIAWSPGSGSPRSRIAEVAPAAPSPEVPSPGLQPGDSSHAVAGQAALTPQFR